MSDNNKWSSSSSSRSGHKDNEKRSSSSSSRSGPKVYRKASGTPLPEGVAYYETVTVVQEESSSRRDHISVSLVLRAGVRILLRRRRRKLSLLQIVELSAERKI